MASLPSLPWSTIACSMSRILLSLFLGPQFRWCSIPFCRLSCRLSHICGQEPSKACGRSRRWGGAPRAEPICPWVFLGPFFFFVRAWGLGEAFFLGKMGGGNEIIWEILLKDCESGGESSALLRVNVDGYCNINL